MRGYCVERRAYFGVEEAVEVVAVEDAVLVAAGVVVEEMVVAGVVVAVAGAVVVAGVEVAAATVTTREALPVFPAASVAE